MTTRRTVESRDSTTAGEAQMTDNKDMLVELGKARTELQPRLAEVYRERLQQDLFASGSQMRPLSVRRIAADEAKSFWDHLIQPDRLRPFEQGAQLVAVGLNEETFFQILQETQAFVRLHLAAHVHAYVANAVDSYQRSLIQGFSAERKRALLDEQERMRAAFERTLSRYTRELELAAEVARAATSILDLNELLKTVTEHIRQSFNHSFAGVFLLDEFNQFVILRAGTGFAGQELLRRGYKVGVGDDTLVGWCAAHGSVRIGHDIGDDAVQFNTPYLSDTHSEIVLPLKLRGDLIGVLSVQSRHVAAFTEHDTNALRVVADQLAYAIENARLFSQAQDSLKAMRATQTAALNRTWAGASPLGAYLYEQSTDTFKPAPDLWNPERLPDGLQQQPVVVQPDGADVSGSVLALPLTLHDQLIGTIDLYDLATAKQWNDQDIALAQAVSAQAALALENARLLQGTQNALADTEALYVASTELNLAHSYDDVLAVLRRNTLLGSAHDVYIGYFDRHWMRESMPASVEIIARWATSESHVQHSRYALNSMPSAPALLRSDLPTLIEDVLADPRLDDFTRALFAEQFGAKSTIFVPLVVGGEWVGYINAHFPERRTFNQAEVHRLIGLTQQAAVGIQNMRLVTALEQRVRERTRELSRANSQLVEQNEFMEGLHETTLGLLNRLELADVLQSIVVRAAALAGTQHGYLFLLEPGEAEMVMQVGAGFFSQRVGDRIKPGQSVAGVAWQSGQPLAVGDYPNWPGRVPHPVFDQLKTLMAVPLKSGDKVVGVLGLGHVQMEAQQTLDETEMARTVQFAQLASIAVDNARLYSNAQAELEERRRVEVKLAKARDEALEASRLKSEFLANMSHEIRTPMNAVIGMTGLLANSKLDTRQRYFVETIRNSSDALLAIIDDILDLSKMEAGKLELENIEFEPLAAVEQSAELLAPRAREKNLVLMTYVSPDIPRFIKGDPVRLRQVLLNLMGNAIKFTERGEVVVTVELTAETQTQLTLKFAVSDTGVGISKAARERLFQPFMQADGSTTRKYGGTGLGLSISKHLVSLMQGCIDVESEEGKGATFWFNATFERSSSGSRSKALDVHALQGLRVLIVDDSKASRELLRRYVKSWGMRSSLADSADEGLERLRGAVSANEPYHVVLVDLVVAGMDVFAFAQRLRTDPALHNTPLILVSTADEEGLEQRALEAGFAAYLTTPVRQSSLFDKLATVVYRSPAAASQSKQWFRAENDDGLQTAATAATGENLILIAEDHPVNREVAILQLQQIGVAAHAVENGIAAVEAVQRVPYALVLMDCQMPEMDGYEATRFIRRAEGDTGRHVPIIAMTAHAMQGDREACLAAGMDDYLAKPVTMERLEDVLRRWMPRTKLQPLNAAQTSKPAIISDTPPQTTAVDYKVIEDLRSMQGADTNFLNQLVTTFFAQTGTLLAAMRGAIERNDPEALRLGAHKLKGGCAVLGVKNLANLCYELEMQGRTGKLDGALEKIQRAELEYEGVKTALQPELQGGIR